MALREALVKLKEIELQSTENRVKVGAVQNRVAEFMYTFESTFTGKNAVSSDDYQTFQDEIRSRMTDIVDTINDNCESNTALLTSTAEGLVHASVQAAAAEQSAAEEEGGSASSNKSGESLLEEIAEEMDDIYTKGSAIKQRLESRLLETQHTLALAHDEEHAAKREVAKMSLQVANSKAEIRRVWNESQEKLKGLKEVEMKLHGSLETIKKLNVNMKAREEINSKKINKIRKEMTLVENSRNELREKLTQVDVIIQNIEMERDAALEDVVELKKEHQKTLVELVQHKKEQEQMVRLQKEKSIEHETKIMALKKEGEGHRSAMAAMKTAFQDELATAKNDGNQLMKRKLDEAEELKTMEMEELNTEHSKAVTELQKQHGESLSAVQNELKTVIQEKEDILEASSNEKEKIENLEKEISTLSELADSLVRYLLRNDCAHC